MLNLTQPSKYERASIYLDLLEKWDRSKPPFGHLKFVYNKYITHWKTVSRISKARRDAGSTSEAL